jgi:DNA-directed RNA polymerase subunit alpha
MLAIRNFGKKSLDELVDKLRDKNYLDVPGVDLSAFWESSTSSNGADIDDEEADELVDEADEA